MLQDTKNLINSQKVEIAQFAYKKFGATFISILNNKNKYLDRTRYAYSHLRFTKVFDKVDGKLVYRAKEDYQDYYFYVTKWTCTDKIHVKGKVEENLADRCFKVAASVLDKHADGDCYFLVDFGQYWAYCSQDYARKHKIDISNYNGKEVYTVRLAQGQFVKKEHNYAFGPESKSLSFDATYIQNVTYDKYRNRGLISVDVFEKGKKIATTVYRSTGEVKEVFKEYGVEYSQQRFLIFAKENRSITVGNFTFVFSKLSLSSLHLVSRNASVNHYILRTLLINNINNINNINIYLNKNEDYNDYRSPEGQDSETKVLEMENDIYISNLQYDRYSNNCAEEDAPLFTANLS